MSIWLDVTTMLSWRRPALGIVRVECETARSFLASGRRDLRFCLFDADRGSYFEVSHETLRVELGRLDKGEADAVPASETQRSLVCSKNYCLNMTDCCKKMAYSFVGALPGRYQGKILLHFRAVYEYLRRSRIWNFLALLVLQRGLKYSLLSNQVHSEETGFVLPERYIPPFAEGDAYISLGIDWDHKDLKYLYELKKIIGLKIFLCCYDIIPILFPQHCVVSVSEKFAVYFADVAWCADVVFCISRCSERDLNDYVARIGAPQPMTRVICLGSDISVMAGLPGDEATVSPEVRQICESQFILYVSTIESRKNHGVLYEAYLDLVNSGRRDLPLLVFVGMQGWGVGELMARIASDGRFSPYVRILNHVSDAELANLYRNTLFTVYPSLYEGWGLPVAESLAHGKFCLASNAASIPEVGGSLIDYLDPHAAESWAATIERFLDNPQELKFREQRIEKEYVPTHWAQTTRNMLEIIETV